jgi:choline dehydrogenase-like flavoprotein
MPLTECTPSDAQHTTWDVVVIGAGGGPAGLNFAKRGKSVLFVERGDPWDGISSASRSPRFHSWDRKVIEPHGSAETETQQSFTVAHAVGGTTSVFAMVMDRFRPVDFTPHRFAHSAPESSLPATWPIEYEELAPYYAQAERLFRVRGSADPLTLIGDSLLTPLPPSTTESRICQTLMEGGLHPYSLHYAREHLEGCDGCPTGPCPKSCKNDAGRLCVVPAVESYGAHLITNCLVTKLETHARTVTRIIGRWNGQRISIRGKIVILAANAVATPALLLRSANDEFPQGIGNVSGMLGRNLMAHVSDYLAVKVDGIESAINRELHNGISFNDFYFHQGLKLGNIHAHAMELLPLLKELAPYLQTEAPEAGTALFATVVEDFPYPQNRVIATTETEDGLTWEYHHPRELRERSDRLISAFSQAIPSWQVIVKRPAGMLNAAHICGTCRFGDDPTTSVLNRNNRAHELDNLFVLDASFFPSSGGINPSLTVVANSLRVSTLID